MRQRGHGRASSSPLAGITAAAPQRGQCLLPRNIKPKHEGQETVARRDWQNWQKEASDELPAPQFGQLRVSACIWRILAVDYEGGLQVERCAILCSQAQRDELHELAGQQGGLPSS